MRKVIGLSVVLLLLLGASLALVAGCGGDKPGSETKTQGSASSSISESELEALIYPGAQEEDIDEREGVAPPDGSSAPMERREGMSDGSGPPMSSAPEDQEGSDGNPGPPGGGGMRGASMIADYWTEDSIEKVSSWYEKELSETYGLEEMTIPYRGGGSGEEGSVKMYSFKLGDTSLMLMLRKDSQDRGGTLIALSEAPEGMPAGPPESEGQ